MLVPAKLVITGITVDYFTIGPNPSIDENLKQELSWNIYASIMRLRPKLWSKESNKPGEQVSIILYLHLKSGTTSWWVVLMRILKRSASDLKPSLSKYKMQPYRT